MEPSVEGPDFATKVRRAEEITHRLQTNHWKFATVPEMFAKATCDVVAKEIVTIHDGRVQTLYGRLVMKGIGSTFQLESPASALNVTLPGRPKLFDDINRQIGSRGLSDFEDFRKLPLPQEAEFFGQTMFYQVRDLVFWSALHECGLSPSGFEELAGHINRGEVVTSLLFKPSRSSKDLDSPVLALAHTCKQFPTPVVQWIPKPLFGGVARETLHIDTLLTEEPCQVSHPFLPLVADGIVVVDNRRYHMRRFAGTSPKDAVRGPGTGAEGPRQS